jgi:hypothetical protein
MIGELLLWLLLLGTGIAEWSVVRYSCDAVMTPRPEGRSDALMRQLGLERVIEANLDL